MLTFNASPDELQLFLEDTEEQLQLLDQDIVLLEKEGTRPELLQEIFRAAHTLKGSSAAIGHRKMASLTHSMESVLDHLRRGSGECGPIVVDALLQSLDALRLFRDEVVSLQDCGFDAAELVKRLDSIAQGFGSQAAARPAGWEIQTDTAGDAAPGADYRITVRISEDCPLPAARCYQVYLETAGCCEVLSVSPPLEEIEQERVGGVVRLGVRAGFMLDEILDHLRALPDVVSATADPLQADEASLPPSPTNQADSPAPSSADVEYGGQSRRVKPSARSNGLAKTVRIDVARLDDLMNLVGELVIDRTRLASVGAKLQTRYDEDAVASLGEISQHLARIVDDLQERIMKARMLPVETLFNRLPRLVRDLAQRSGKKIDFVVDGEETELDRSVIEELHDPLVHLLRNAVDHGIEAPEARVAAGKPEVGKIRLSAEHRENRIVIRVEDDGAGIDPNVIRSVAVNRGLFSAEAADRLSDREALELIFAQGFSTREKVSDVSGRGVGTDIVRTNIERLSGSVLVESTVGTGTCFTLQLPLTVAIMDALTVGLGDQVLAIPLVSVQETLRVKRSEIRSVNQHQVIQLRDTVLPLMDLDKALGFPPSPRSEDRVFVVAVRTGDNAVGLVVDSLLGQLQVVIKSLGKQMGTIAGVTGATILGDGRVALILDVPSLVKCVLEEQSRGWAA